MGTWGSGNFQSDGALDYVGELMEQLTNRITDTFDDETGLSRLDEDVEAVIVPGIAVMSILTEHCHSCPPQVSLTGDWKTRYLEIFDTQIDGSTIDTEYLKERRTIIVATFEKLEEQSRSFWGDNR